MDESSRQLLLENLEHSSSPALLAGVLGGVFAEGIDLPAGSLHTLLVVGPGLPPPSLSHRLLREHYASRGSDGYLYASLIPGITRVIQAAGRLVRRPTDRGVVVLIGRRFRWHSHADLLPKDWSPTVTLDPAPEIEKFWKDNDGPTF